MQLQLREWSRILFLLQETSQRGDSLKAKPSRIVFPREGIAKGNINLSVFLKPEVDIKMSYSQDKKEWDDIGGNATVLSNTCITFQTEEKIVPIFIRANIPVGLQEYLLFQP